MNVVFCGSTAYSVRTLEAVCVSSHKVVLVVTQPDRPKGRKRKLQRTALAEFALSASLPLFQPDDINGREAVSALEQAAPDIVVTAAFGQILKEKLLRLPPRGCINSHASLLPKYRGAAPIAAAIRAGEERTGVTIFKMERGMDSGPLLVTRETEIAPDDTAGSLEAKLAALSGAAVAEALERIADGSAEFKPQDHSRATFAPKIGKADARVKWSRTARELDCFVRAMTPNPGAFTDYREKGKTVTLGILKAAAAEEPEGGGGEPGTILKRKDGFFVKTGKGCLRLLEVRKEGKRALDAAAFFRGARMDEERFTG